MTTARSGLRPGSASLLVPAVFFGGAAGALSRAALQQWWPPGDGWPWGTFVANLTGTVILALLAAMLTPANDPARLWRGLLGTGFCGALTTFSAFQVEVITLVKDGRPGVAVGYGAASLVIGLALGIGVGAGVRRVRFG